MSRHSQIGVVYEGMRVFLSDFTEVNSNLPRQFLTAKSKVYSLLDEDDCQNFALSNGSRERTS